MTEQKGVKTLPPPPEFAGAISRAIENFAATLPEGKRGGMVGVATTVGINVAIVQRVGENHQIVGWVASKWGKPDLEAGIAWKSQW